jgi:ubiquinone/menaquinone biosynthesis C-methylase UbiE
MHMTRGRAQSPETPDIATSSEDYARRFSGQAGRFFLETQENAVTTALGGRTGFSVLEVGGGHGQLVPLFLRLGCRLTMHGSDASTHQRVRAAFPDAVIRFASGSVLDLPYADRSFDVVVAVRLVSHVNAWARLIDELCRVARASVLIDYPTWRSLNVLTPLLFRLKKAIEGNTRTYASFSDARIAAAFQRSGFRVASVQRQFFLPMFVHRALGGARWLQSAERNFGRTGLTKLLGSPVVVRADRVSGAT